MRLVLGLALSLVACDAALGIEVLPRRTEAPVVYASDACAACARTCAPQRTTCGADGACDILQRCTAKCGANDAHCRMQCEQASPLAVTGVAYKALDHCLRNQCTEACLGVSGMGSIFGPACGCLDGPCGSETLACVRAGRDDNPGACERSLSCIAQSGLDPDHAQECMLRGRVDAEIGELRRCWSTVTCPACPLAKDGALGCLGAYRWQVPTARTIRTAITVTTFDNLRKPVPGVTVSACNAGSCANCVAPLSSAVSDGAGNVTLDLPTGITGFGGCIRLNGPGFVPMIMHAGYPLVRDVAFSMFVVETAALPLLGKLLGTETRADRGHLVSIVTDCVNSPLSGVRVDVEPTDDAVRSGSFINSAIDPAAKVTGALGTTLFVNLPPRETPFSVVSAHRGELLISRSYAAIVPGAISVLFSVPRTAD
jgi:hypothetical protein